MARSRRICRHGGATSAASTARSDLDGTPNKSRLGANAILGVSLAVANAAAEAQDCRSTDIWAVRKPRVAGADDEHHQWRRACRQPVDFQEFMIMPVGGETIAEALRIGAEVFHNLKKVLKDEGHNTKVGDEGGFAPNLASNEGDRSRHGAIEKAGYKRGRGNLSGAGPAATEFFDEGRYDLEGRGARASPRRRWSTSMPRWPQLSDRLHRGRHGPGRLGRLAAG